MQVEVNEQNIILFKLVELTGNSAEDMLLRAREAFANGYTLTCEVPEEHVFHANTFDVFNGQEADPNLGNDPHPLQHGIDDRPKPDWGPNVIIGEVVRAEDLDTSHIPFPPDMVPFEDEE